MILTLRCLNMVAGSATELTTWSTGVGFALNRINFSSVTNFGKTHRFVAPSVDLKVCILQVALNNCVSAHSITAVLRTQEDHNKKRQRETLGKEAHLL